MDGIARLNALAMVGLALSPTVAPIRPIMSQGVSRVALIGVVDDSRLARAFAAAALRKAGHEVVELEPLSLTELLDRLRELRPQLLVLDHHMPACSGPSVVRACFQDEALAAIKVVMLTAHHEDEMEQRMEKLGVHAVLHKPVEPQRLADTVAQVLGG